MQKNKWTNAALVLIGIVLGVFAAELVLRISGVYPILHIPPYLFANHSTTWWTLRPNFADTIETPDGPVTYRINSQGLRAPDDIVYKESAPAPGIFLSGDSFTFGQGINEADTFAARLPALLAAKGLPVQVINLGVPAFGTMHSFHRLVEFVQKLGRPDMVIYMFTPNDPIDNISGEKQVVNGVKMDKKLRFKELLSYIAHLYSTFRTISIIIDFYYDDFSNPIKIERRVLEESGVSIESRRDFLVTKEYLTRFIDFTEQRGIRFAVFTSKNSKYSAPLRAFLTAYGVPMVESEQFFARAGGDKHSIGLIEGHWNANGHALVARGMAEFVEHSGWAARR